MKSADKYRLSLAEQLGALQLKRQNRKTGGGRRRGLWAAYFSSSRRMKEDAIQIDRL